MKILVIQQKMIGDVLATSVVCNNLKKMYPHAQVDYMVYPFTTPVIENNPNIDNIIVFADGLRESKMELLRFLKSIRKRRYDIVIDAYGKIESNLVVLFSGAKKKIGFHKSYTDFLYTSSIREISAPTTNAGTAIENRMNLLKPLDSRFVGDLKPKIFLTQKEIENGRKILEDNNIDLSRKMFMIGVVGSGDNKTYPFGYMAKILDRIVAETNAILLFNYMPKQLQQAQAIYDVCETFTQKNIKINVIPGSIREFLAITNHCDALIGNEGGAVNMAKAIGKPTFTIFSTWIKKEAWNSFEDGITHVSVHLKEFKPELYGEKSPKEMKSRANELYKEFTPDLVLPTLIKYLKT